MSKLLFKLRNVNKRYLFLSIVMIIFLTILFDTFSLFYNKKTNSEEYDYSNTNENAPLLNQLSLEEIRNPSTKNIIIMADSHNNSKIFPEIKKIIDRYSVSILFHLGDHSDYGSNPELLDSKNLLDSLNIDYFVLPGDRDLAAANGDEIFYKYFKKIEYVDFGDLNFVLFDNSPNFTPLKDSYLNRINDLIKTGDILLSSQPLFVEKGNIFESKYMGSLNKDYLEQRDLILENLRRSNIKFVISGDHHRSSTFKDPINKSITYYIVGATAENLNSNGIVIKQKSFQSQRILLISITEERDIYLKEIEVFEE